MTIIFQMGWFNHHLDNVSLPKISQQTTYHSFGGARLGDSCEHVIVGMGQVEPLIILRKETFIQPSVFK